MIRTGAEDDRNLEDPVLRRRVPGRSALPGSRAVVGGLLMALAAVGTFVAWSRATHTSDTAYVVAARPLPPGQELLRDDLRVIPMHLHADVAPGAFADMEEVVGRVLRGPVAEGELLQAGLLDRERPPDMQAELAFALPRDRAVDGRLEGGDRVDIFVTDGGRTRLVMRKAPVLVVREPLSTTAAGALVTVTIGLDDPSRHSDVIHAVTVGDVTLVRSTFAPDGDAEL